MCVQYTILKQKTTETVVAISMQTGIVSWKSASLLELAEGRALWGSRLRV